MSEHTKRECPVGLAKGQHNLTSACLGVALCAASPLLAAAHAQAQGLMGFYYRGTGFEELQATRVDPSLDTTWPAEAMPEGMSNQNFSVRWLGRIRPRYGEAYELLVTTDDGLRLWVNGELLVDTWIGQGPTTYRGRIALQADRPYNLMMEYYQGGGGARTTLEWASPSQVREVIPSDRMEPTPSPPPEPVVRLFTAGGRAGERSPEQGRFLLTRFGDWSAPLTVSLTAGGDATPGEDYAALPATITIPTGRTSAGLDIQVLDDALDEPAEIVQLGLAPGEGYVVGEPARGEIEITDNDAATGPTAFSVVGALDHGGASTGHLVAVVWHDSARANEAGRATLVAPGIYSVPALAPGRYYVSAFLDEDRDGVLDQGEPAMDGPAVDLPPDALEVNFDFSPPCASPGCDEPDAGADLGPDAAPDLDDDAGDDDAGGDDAGDGAAHNNNNDDGGGCQQSGGALGSAASWIWLWTLGLALWRRRPANGGA